MFLFLLIVDQWCSCDAIASIEIFDPTRNEWRAVASMSKRTFGVDVLNNLSYAIVNKRIAFSFYSY